MQTYFSVAFYGTLYCTCRGARANTRRTCISYIQELIYANLQVLHTCISSISQESRSGKLFLLYYFWDSCINVPTTVRGCVSDLNNNVIFYLSKGIIRLGQIYAKRLILMQLERWFPKRWCNLYIVYDISYMYFTSFHSTLFVQYWLFFLY